MLPSYSALLERHRWLCRTRGYRYGQREMENAQIAVLRARHRAGPLCAERPEDEPAAMLLALLAESQGLGPARNAFPVLVAQHMLRERGAILRLDLRDRLQLHATRITAMHSPSEIPGLLSALRRFLDERCRRAR